MTQQDPKIVYFAKGSFFVAQAIASARSLRLHQYDNIRFYVSSMEEMNTVLWALPNSDVRIQDVDTGEYPKISHKIFAIDGLPANAFQGAQEWVVCDTDILWHCDPRPLFARYKNKAWFHKITAVQPSDYTLNLSQINRSNTPLWTILSYARDHGVHVWPNYIVNGGLFKMSCKHLSLAFRLAKQKVVTADPSDMLLSEALLSIALAELQITPYADKQDIKYFGRQGEPSDLKMETFSWVDFDHASYLNGYKIAHHYYGNQDWRFLKDAMKMGIAGGLVTHLISGSARRLLARVKRKLAFLRPPC